MRKNDNTLVIFAVFVLSIIALYFINYERFNPRETLEMTDTAIVTKTDTIWESDTFRIVQPIPYEVIKTKTDTVYSKNGEEIELVSENKIYKDTITTCAKDTMLLTSYIKGINATLDSTTIRLVKSKEIVTNTIEVTKYIKEKKGFWNRFHVSPQVGVGYGIVNRNIDVYVGVGMAYNF